MWDNSFLNFNGGAVSGDKIAFFYLIINAVSSVNKFPILIFQKNLQLQIVKVHKLFNRLKFTNIFVHNVTVSGNYIYSFNKTKILIGINLFTCRNRGYILHRYLCDGIKDCPNDNSDEYLCVCDEEQYSKSRKNICMIVQSRYNTTHCSHNYYMDMKGTCKKYGDNMVSNEKKSQILT